MAGHSRLPANKHLWIPQDARWDWDAMRCVLRQIRLHQRLTVRELADLIGVTQAQLGHWEWYHSKRHTVPLDRIKKEWANTLGYTLTIQHFHELPYTIRKKTNGR